MNNFENPLEKIVFPVYRKYKNSTSYFKIMSPTNFEEKKLLNKQFVLFQFEANILPDRNYISDLVLNYEMFAIVIDAEDYEQI